jgi:murein DD-endopeptidase MepM/ murein hydrolase activator NlpD
MLFNPLAGQSGTEFRVTQWFGENPKIYAQFGHRGHNGIDYAPKIPRTRGAIVHAPHEGYVSVKDEGKKGYGLHVEIISLPYKHGLGRKSVLAHFEKCLVTNGQFVSSGDPVGVMGSTGFSTGIHCHWTYKKTDSLGNTLDKNNGFAGAIDIARYTQQWKAGNLLLPFPP